MPADPIVTWLLYYFLLLASTLAAALSLTAAGGLLDSWPVLDARDLRRAAPSILLVDAESIVCAYTAYTVHPGRGALIVLALSSAAALLTVLTLLFAWAARGPGRGC